MTGIEIFHLLASCTAAIAALGAYLRVGAAIEAADSAEDAADDARDTAVDACLAAEEASLEALGARKAAEASLSTLQGWQKRRTAGLKGVGAA